MSRMLMRDPFARMELWVTRVYDPTAVCKFCGDVKRTPKGRTFLYTFTIRHDAGRVNHYERPFCSKDCWASWHG